VYLSGAYKPGLGTAYTHVFRMACRADHWLRWCCHIIAA